jgi:hypothetical protein
LWLLVWGEVDVEDVVDVAEVAKQAWRVKDASVAPSG